ncbi:MAG: hypothetical protein ACP5KV_06480 [Candidatus Methanomethylicaceae archaeon]
MTLHEVPALSLCGAAFRHRCWFGGVTPPHPISLMHSLFDLAMPWARKIRFKAKAIFGQ